MTDSSSVRSLLRFLTCGSVDDGKSTLIGRLLHDAGLVAEDQWATVVKLSAQRGQTGDQPDYSLLLDGLLDERAQGITIDVAWRYFQTERRKFILGDAPGHEQYTRNMATAASQCQLALILVDARKGILPQTRRHAAIVSLLGIRHVVVVVNKMDLVGWDELAFIDIQRDFLAFAKPLGLAQPVFLPVSAVQGENVVHPGRNMPWYTGKTLLQHLEAVDTSAPAETRPLRYPVQWVSRAGDFRGYAGTVASGYVRKGDAIRILPSGTTSKVARIVTFDGERDEACAGEACTLTLADDIDVTRGDTLVQEADRTAVVTDRLEANVIWMDEAPLLPGRRYEMRVGTSSVPGTIKRLIHRLDLETMRREQALRLEKNDIGQCEVMTERPIVCDVYSELPMSGHFILIDRMTNATVAAGLVTANQTRQVFWEEVAVDKIARARVKGQKPLVVWFTGLSGAGKSTLANALEQALHREGFHTYLIDGDNIRHGLSRDLGFAPEDRIENTRRVGELAKLMVDAGLIVLVSLISPFRAEREMVRDLVEPGEFMEVYVSTSLEVCESRDTKGLYRLAREGKLQNFTGISSPYEPPEAPELSLDTSVETLESSLRRIIQKIKER